MSIKKDVGTTVQKGAIAYKELEQEIKKQIDDKGVEYVGCHERPIAAFMTEWLSRNLIDDSVVKCFHELPIAGLHEDEITRIRNQFIKGIKFQKQLLKKEYTNYNIDGYLVFDDDSDLFIEYKVNTGFSFTNLAIDLLKFYLYTAYSENDEQLLYIVFYKDGDSFKDVDPEVIVKSPIDIQNSNIKGKNLFYFNTNSINKIDEEWCKKSIVALTQIGSYDVEGKISISGDLYSRFKNSLAIQYSEIYGNNVLFSLKMQANSKWIIDYAEKVRKKLSLNPNITIETYQKIRKFIDNLLAGDIANSNKSDAFHKTHKQRSNWLISILLSGLKKLNINDYIPYIIEDVTINGKVKKNEEIKSGFKGMLEEAEKALNNLDSEIKKENIDMNCNNMIYHIFRHIKEAYSITRDLESYENITDNNVLPEMSEDYKSYTTLKKALDNFKSIEKAITNVPMTAERILSIYDYSESLSKKILDKMFEKI